MSASPIETYAERIRASQSLAAIGDSDGSLRLLDVEDAARRAQIKIVKPQDHVIVPDRRLQLLRRIDLIETELGRMQKLVNELRADALHLTTE